MVDFSILLGLTPDGDDVARHIKRKKIVFLKRDADKLSKKSSTYINKVVQDAVGVLGDKLKPKSKESNDQAYLIGFVADLTGDASTLPLHYLVHDYHVETHVVVDAFHAAIGSGDNDRAMNLMKAFPELVFEEFADFKCVYEQFTDENWIELLKAKVINSSFFENLSDEQVLLLFKAMPAYTPLLNSKSLIAQIKGRPALRNALLTYFDQLIKAKDPKAAFIMRVANMPLTSCDSDGNWRIVAYCKALSCDEGVTDTMGSIKKVRDVDFLTELLAVVDIPSTLEAYQMHLQIGRLLCILDGLKHKILDHIKDPTKRHERYEILNYCMEVYERSSSSKEGTS